MVEIETEWNLELNPRGGLWIDGWVEIETEWNLELANIQIGVCAELSRDRNRVEFRVSCHRFGR